MSMRASSGDIQKLREPHIAFNYRQRVQVNNHGSSTSKQVVVRRMTPYISSLTSPSLGLGSDNRGNEDD